jgi:NaMN:DMB phosphoribosyltransferase
LNDFEFFGNIQRAENFVDKIKNGNFLFSLVISYTETCEIPGITFAGADKDSIKYTPPADAEYLYYGNCKTIDKIPMTPDGKPTPALLTKTALESSSIPHIVINAGSKISPQLPFIQTGLSPGKNISVNPAMTDSQVTALAVMKAFGYKARVSSSIPNNPVILKNQIASMALEGLDSDNPYNVIAKVGDPMIPFVTGMLSSASEINPVILAGGTQMTAVLAFASKIGFNEKNTAIGTTCYISEDENANFKHLVSEIADIPAIAVNPRLENSKFPGLKAFSEGFAKEGAGAGGSIIASMLKTNNNSSQFLELAEKEYHRIFTSL